jgi:hypothetical protein
MDVSTTSTPRRCCTRTISATAFRCQGSCLGELLKVFATMTYSSNASQRPQVNLVSLLTKSAWRLYVCFLMELPVISLMSICIWASLHTLTQCTNSVELPLRCSVVCTWESQTWRTLNDYCPSTRRGGFMTDMVFICTFSSLWLPPPPLPSDHRGDPWQSPLIWCEDGSKPPCQVPGFLFGQWLCHQGLIFLLNSYSSPLPFWWFLSGCFLWPCQIFPRCNFGQLSSQTLSWRFRFHFPCLTSLWSGFQIFSLLKSAGFQGL